MKGMTAFWYVWQKQLIKKSLLSTIPSPPARWKGRAMYVGVLGGQSVPSTRYTKAAQYGLWRICICCSWNEWAALEMF